MLLLRDDDEGGLTQIPPGPSAEPLSRRVAHWSPALSPRPTFSPSTSSPQPSCEPPCSSLASPSWPSAEESLAATPPPSRGGRTKEVAGEQLLQGWRKKKRCGFIMLVIESAAASCGIPNDSFGKNHSTLSRRLLHTGCKVLDDRPIWSVHLFGLSKIITVHLFGLSKIIKFASKFIGVHAFHNAISRSCVLSNKSAKAKMIKNSNASTWRQADRPTTSQSTRDKKRNGKSEKKKKDVGSSSL